MEFAHYKCFIIIIIIIIRYFIILRLGEGLTSFNKNNSAWELFWWKNEKE